jgi:hypothetical protein
MTTDSSTLETTEKIMRLRDRPQVIFGDWRGML